MKTSTEIAAGRVGANFVRVTLLFAFLGTIFDGMELNLVSYPLVYIAHSMAVATASIVAVITAQSLASLAGGFAFGWLGDTLGRRKSFALCVCLYGIGSVLAGMASNYPFFLGTRVLAGIGIGGEFGLAYAMFAEAWPSKRRGLVGGAIGSMFVVGLFVTQGVLYLALHSLGNDAGWRVGFYVIGAISLLLAVAGWLWIPESEKWLTYQRSSQAGTLPTELQRTKVPFVDLFRGGLAIPTIGLCVAATGVFMYTYSFQVYASTFLLTVAHSTLGVTTTIIYITQILNVALFLIWGHLSDSLGRRKTVLAYSVVALLGAIPFLVLVAGGHNHIGSAYWDSPMFWAVLALNLASGGFGLFGVWMSEIFPTRIRATGANSVYYAARGLGSGLYPLITLTLVSGNVGYAIALAAAGAFFAFGGAWFTQDRTGREIHAVE